VSAAEEPLVSVVTIFLDPGPYLLEAVASVRAQTVPDWELLLVDDGSTDGSSDVARALAAEDPGRIRRLTHPDGGNHGMSASRNLGVRHARGRFVAFLDADDVYLPDKLRTGLDLLERHPGAELAYGPMSLWFSWSGRPEDRSLDRVRATRAPLDRVIEPPALFVSYVRGLAPTPATCSVLLRRELFDRVGGFEETFRGMFEDQAFFCKVALHARCVVTDRPGDLYRQHPGSETARSLRSGHWHRSRPNPARRAFLEWLADYAVRHGMSDGGAAAALRHELWPYRHPWAAAVVSRAAGLRDAVRRQVRRRGDASPRR
jgi:GT2 family glycosyltransferase